MMAQAARDFTAAADVFRTARNNFNDRLAQDAYPRPWTDDQTGQIFASSYEPAESGTKTALDDLVTGLDGLSEMFTKMSMSYQSVEEANSR